MIQYNYKLFFVGILMGNSHKELISYHFCFKVQSVLQPILSKASTDQLKALKATRKIKTKTNKKHKHAVRTHTTTHTYHMHELQSRIKKCDTFLFSVVLTTVVHSRYFA